MRGGPSLWVFRSCGSCRLAAARLVRSSFAPVPATCKGCDPRDGIATREPREILGQTIGTEAAVVSVVEMDTPAGIVPAQPADNLRRL